MDPRLPPCCLSYRSALQLLVLVSLSCFASLFNMIRPAYCSRVRYGHPTEAGDLPSPRRVSTGSSSSLANEYNTPMIFIFGASMVDAGENAVAMPLRSHADFAPYGSDYFGKPSGRWSNGRNFMDFITEGLGYDHIPPYLRSIGSVFSHGVNFASSGSTATNSTASGNDSSGLFCLLVQVDQFRSFQDIFLSTSTQQYACKEKWVTTLKQRFSDSIYFVETAHNDYMIANSAPDSFDLNTTVSAVIASMKAAFEALYGFGARTFVIMNVTPLGCSPAMLNHAAEEGKPLDENNCVASWTEIVNAHNERLNDLLNEMRTVYPAAEWILFDAHSLFLDGYINPSKYGIKNPFQACCGAGGTYNINSKVVCGMDAQYINETRVEWTKCQDPKLHLIWDTIHPVESFAYYIAQGVLNGTHLTPPFNIKERVAPLKVME